MMELTSALLESKGGVRVVGGPRARCVLSATEDCCKWSPIFAVDNAGLGRRQ